MKNKKLLKFSLSIIVILMCILLSNNSPFFKISLKDRVSNITQSDINVTIINETELEIENLIKSSDLQYSWIVTNKIRGKNISGSDFLPTKENRVISFTYEDLSTITFKPVVKYNNITYTGQTFIINEDGSFYQDLESEKTAPVYQSNGTRSVTQYVSIMYLLFLIIVATIFYIAPKKYKSIVLLFSSLYFYYLSGIQYLVIVLFTAICTYFITNCMNKNNQKTNLLIEQSETPKEKRILKKESKDKNRQTLFIGIIASLGPMLIIKYADLLPGLTPAYVFIICAILSFFIKKPNGEKVMEWKSVQKLIVWDLIYVFAGGLAVGTLINGSGAADAFGNLFSSVTSTNELVLIFIILVFTTILSDLTSNTATATIAMPIVLNVAIILNLNPVPYILTATVGVNLAYCMPTSIRAIPVGYGLNPKYMFNKGLLLTLIITLIMTPLIWSLVNFFPYFSTFN